MNLKTIAFAAFVVCLAIGMHFCYTNKVNYEILYLFLSTVFLLISFLEAIIEEIRDINEFH